MSAGRSIAGMLLLFLLSFSSFPVAQSRSDARLRLVSAKEGDAIIQAAWDLRRLNPKPDCSHFVHDVYAKAGFIYEYAVTRDVFVGLDGFRRVEKPQPGDLIVWQGHIGIVLDPGEHSFYSSVLSGFAIENYQSHYWVARGYPRFYRFVVTSPRPPKPALTKIARVHPASNQPSLQLQPGSSQKPAFAIAGSPNQPPLQPGSSQKPALAVAGLPNQPPLRPGSSQKPALAVAGSPNQPPLRPGSSQKPALAVAGSLNQPLSQPGSSQKPALAAAGSPNQPLLRPGSSQKPAPAVADSTEGASRQPAQVEVEPSARAKVDAAAGKMATRDPAVPKEIFVTSQATPTRPEVLAAIIRAAGDNGERLLRDRLLDSQPSVAVADDFRVVSLDLQGKTGLAEVEVKEIAAFRHGKPTWSQLVSRRRVILSRQQQGWILVTPQELLYLNRHLAVVALTDQLTALSKAPADQLQAKKTSKMLHELLSPKSAGANAEGSN